MRPRDLSVSAVNRSRYCSARPATVTIITLEISTDMQVMFDMNMFDMGI